MNMVKTSVIQIFGGCSVFAVLFLKWFLSITVRHAQKQHSKNTASPKYLNYRGLTDRQTEKIEKQTQQT